jgi:RHH-type proline utilization regulon transcriptional repressor/proline dehydrogenase/delta 1-pyrroline-5-carboxylate dehydrogenase
MTTVLVVDDEPIVREVVVKYLRREGFRTLEAADGHRARELLERDSLGPLPRTNLSVKVTALTPLMRPQAPEVGRDDAAERMRPLLRRARDLGMATPTYAAYYERQPAAASQSPVV